MIVDEGRFNESSYDSSRLTSIKATGLRHARPEPLGQNCRRYSRGSSAEHLLNQIWRRFLSVKVLNAIKTVPEVCTIRRATANPIEVGIVETEPERGHSEDNRRQEHGHRR